MRARLSRITAAATGGWRPSAARPSAHALPGWFIAVEGGDGAGKTTQIDALARWLRKRGFDVVTTREPGATVLGAKLREILLHTKDREPVGARAEALLFAADRADHVEKVVRPALERGAIVLTDRHVDSSIAYQSGGRGLPVDQIAALSEFATEGLRPDLVVLLDVDPQVAWERAQTRGGEPDRLEAEPEQFHGRVREAFRSRAAADPDRYLVVDAAEPPGVIIAIVQDRLEELLPLSSQEQAEARAREKALREAEKAELREREARLAAERAEAERAEQRRRAEQEAARQEEERRREQARQEQARRAAEERARYERQKEEERRRADEERREEQLREAGRREQAETDAEHRRQIELAVRQIEARAKGAARERAARELPPGATAAAATAARRSVDQPGSEPDEAGSDVAQSDASASAGIDQTAVLPVDLEPTQALSALPDGLSADRGGVDVDDDDDDDDAPRSRWHLSLGKRKL
ncbi:dTMP kinase [Actinocrinis puniceicyclus]|uniref:Thymidylate kinase n=1 Tax=Actinocrinis puniceicyclus TaxID=977794 RepID=A0A8J7WIF6_9ACTN|nr:dTMP kinase [Actinocrinis puniceicyclus]MBS2962786.1 dTMP kinase [Actinocrinis puniceicyclus]